VSHRLSCVLWNPSNCILKQVYVEPLLALNMMLTAPAERCPQRAWGYWSIFLPAGHSAANLLATIAAVNQWDRQTDTRLLHRPCSAYYAGSINNNDPENTGRSITSWRPKATRPMSAGFHTPSADAARWQRTYTIVPTLTGRGVSGWIGSMAFLMSGPNQSHLPNRGIGSPLTAA